MWCLLSTPSDQSELSTETDTKVNTPNRADRKDKIEEEKTTRHSEPFTFFNAATLATLIMPLDVFCGLLGLK